MTIGLTGGIGSGKSTVAKLFQVLDCPVFNSDEAAKQVYFNDSVRSKVIQLLGEASYLDSKNLNRTYISSKIFSDSGLLEQINNIIHPEVKKCFEQFKLDNHGKIIIKESALLFEAKIDKDLDKIILVAAKDELRISRVIKRDGISREMVTNKMNAQMPQEEKIKLAHYIIYNNEEEFLISQVLKIFDELKFNNSNNNR